MKHPLTPRVLLIGIAIAAAQTGFGQIFTDDFNRANTDYSFTNPNLIGADYEIQQPDTSGWRINNNSLQVGNQTGGPKVMAQTDLGTLNTGGQSFTLQADISLNAISNNRWVGLAFNADDSGNFYAVRIGISGTTSVFQVLQTTGFTDNDALVNTTSPAAYTAGEFYRLTISSDTPYDFDISLATIGATPTTLFDINVTDPESAYSNGLSGFYAVTGNAASFDNYSLTVVPEPGVTALLMAGFGMMVIMLKRRRNAAV